MSEAVDTAVSVPVVTRASAPATPGTAAAGVTEPNAWRVLRRQAERRRYLSILTPRRVGKEKPRRPSPAVGVPRDAHHLLRSPAEMTRTATNFPDPEHVRQYLRHSCDVTMSGGLAASLVYPLGVCALAEHYVLRRVGGSSVAAVVAAASAAAEVGRGAPDAASGQGAAERDPLTVAPGYAGLAEIVGWLTAQDVAGQDAASLAAGRTPSEEAPEQWRLARMLQPAGRTRVLYRLFAAVQRMRSAGPDERGRARRRLLLGLLAGFTNSTRVAAATAWLGSLAGWALLTWALATAPGANPVVVAVASVVVLLSAVLAGLGLSVATSFVAVRDLVTRRAPQVGFGLVPGVAVDWTSKRRRRRLTARLDALAGMPAPDGVPALATWVTDRLDDLAGMPHGRLEARGLFDSAGLLHDGGMPGADADATRSVLTFGDLWLGRAGVRTPEDDEVLRRAATDPEHRVVDLQLTTTNVTQRRPYRFPLPVADELERRGLTRFLFCRSCLEEVLPLRVVVQLVKTSPSVESDHSCPRHDGALLHELPDPWDVPVALAVRMSMAVPGLLSAVPLATVEAELDRPERGSVRLHWFADGDLTASMPVGAFDTLLPRWPTFGFHVQEDGAGLGAATGSDVAAGAAAAGDAPDAEQGPDDEPVDLLDETEPRVAQGVYLPVQDAVRRPVHWQQIATTGAFVRMLASTTRSWGDASVADLPGYRGRVARVLAGGTVTGGGARAAIPFVPQRTILALALRGFAAGEALRTRFTGSDEGIAGQTQTDRYRWIRLRTALREYRGLSLSIGARLPLYSDLASGYRVPAGLAAWFPDGIEPGSRDPKWPEAAATVTHLRALSAGGVLDWDADLGAPPVDPDLRLIPPM